MNKIALKRPPSLQKGDRIGIVSLASKVATADMQTGIAFMQETWGLEVVLGESIAAEDHTFAGTDAARLKDFQTMLDDASIKAVFSSRGGYGSTRIIDAVDWRGFKKNPKWVIGFSDITAVHGRLQNLGYQSIHGPMPRTFGKPETQQAVAYLKQILFGEAVFYDENQSFSNQFQNRVGQVEAQIVGGNLCMLAHSIGSESELDTKGKILFIEDIDEYRYGIDRMLVQLQRAGKLKDLAGLIVGYFSESKDGNVPFGKTESEIVAAHVATYDFPVAYHFPIGHEDYNLAIPCGRIVKLDVAPFGAKLTF
jgi:muramoyltetrapeptide carboxypeptidase